MRQMNLYYPQVKHTNSSIGGDALNSGAPLITFDHHYSSDEDMVTAGCLEGAKKIKVAAMSQCATNTGKRKIGWIEDAIPAVKAVASEEKQVTEKGIEGVIRNKDDGQVVKRRKLENQEINTQSSNGSVLTQSSKISPMRKAASPKLDLSSIKGLSAQTLKQLQSVRNNNSGRSENNILSITTANQIKPLSDQTQRILESLNKSGKIAVPKELPKVSLEELLSQENSMRLKHEQLLAPQRELVIPFHYKKLVEIMKSLDNSLNFLKQCRRQSSCTFEELKKSIEKTSGKQFDTVSLRQILFLIPESYSHKWEHGNLVIDFPNEEKLMTQPKMEERQIELKRILLEKTKIYHDKFLNEEFKEGDTALFENVFDTNMWHHKFDPHSVPAIQMIELKQQSKSVQSHQRSESVKDFLQRSKLILSKPEVDQPLNIINQRSSSLSPSNSIQDQKFVAMSKQMGVSIETLKLIQTKQEQIKAAKENLTKEIAKEDSTKETYDLIKLADQIRATLNHKQKQTLSLKETIQSLNDNMRGQFRAHSEIQSQILRLTILVPEWISLKEIGSAGKFVKCSNTLFTGQQIQESIKQRIAQKAQP